MVRAIDDVGECRALSVTHRFAAEVSSILAVRNILVVVAILVTTTSAAPQSRVQIGYCTSLQNVAAAMTPGQPAHMILYGSLIIFFCFFYTALVFNSRETAENLKKSGAFIPGIRPGQQTGEYIDKVLTRLTVWGALYVTVVCLLPEVMMARFSVPFYFGGTSLLIMVVVIMDFQAQVAAHLMSHQYEGLMKKANLRGYGRPGQT